MTDTKTKRSSRSFRGSVSVALRTAGLQPRRDAKGPGFTLNTGEGSCVSVDVTVYRSAESAARAVRDSLIAALGGKAWRIRPSGVPVLNEETGLYSCSLHIESARSPYVCEDRDLS